MFVPQEEHWVLRTPDLILLPVPPLALPPAPCHVAQAEAAPWHILGSWVALEATKSLLHMSPST